MRIQIQTCCRTTNPMQKINYLNERNRKRRQKLLQSITTQCSHKIGLATNPAMATRQI